MVQNPEERLLFSVAGARGIVGKTFNVDVATRLSLAFCSILPEGSVVVGRDTRPSGESIMNAVVGAVMATGRECIDLGIAATPTVEMIVEKLGAAGGIIVTASHNPIEWNALKFLDARGIFIKQSESERLFDSYTSGDYNYADAASTGKRTIYELAAQNHIDAILGLHSIDVDKIIQRSFKVVLDCINGAGTVIAPQLLADLGVEVVEINCKTDGDFFRNPEPRPENLGELAERVESEGADVGFALDPDADRLALIDNTGRALSEEYTLALAVDQVLATEKKGPVVVNASTSAMIDWVAGRHQASVLRTPVGEAHVVDKMQEEHATIGGEGNGGVIYPELHPGRDGLVGMALILQLLAERGRSLSDILSEYPLFYMSKEKLPLDGDFSVEEVSSLFNDLGPARIETQDGVKAIFDDGWCHVRVSNTEGVVRIIAESLTQERTGTLKSSARNVLRTAWSR